MPTITLTKTTTLALRMTEIVIGNHLNTSLRMPVIRPIFQEIDFRFSSEISVDSTRYQGVIVTVSFLLEEKTIAMTCDCRMQKKLGSGDWQPVEAHFFNTVADKIQPFKFNQFGHLIIED
jgi:hypothetical protein